VLDRTFLEKEMEMKKIIVILLIGAGLFFIGRALNHFPKIEKGSEWGKK
jgi:NADH/NAD ratio-sensing transcriptional regulator Rex